MLNKIMKLLGINKASIASIKEGKQETRQEARQAIQLNKLNNKSYAYITRFSRHFILLMLGVTLAACSDGGGSSNRGTPSNQAPTVTANSGNATLVVAIGESVTIMVTATKRDTLGSGNVSFPRMVNSTGTVCAATIAATDPVEQTYPGPINTANAVASVTYSITSTTATNCGPFTFTATEDGELGTADTLSGVSFVDVDLPPIVTANSGNAPLVVAIGESVTIMVTATKRDNVGSGNVSFPRMVNSADPVCVAMLVGGTGDPVEQTYSSNQIDAVASVTYSIANNGTAIACGDFTFNATEDGELGTATALNGVGFAANEAPIVTATSGDAPLIVALGQSVTVTVTATKRDVVGSGNVSFPSMVNSAGNVCVATLVGGTGNVQTYSSNQIDAVASVTYSITSTTATNCGNFTFTATEDGEQGTATALTGVIFTTNPVVPLNEAPTVTANSGDAPIIVATGVNVSITVTANKQDIVGSGNVSFPRTITSAAPECIATLADSVVRTYSNNTVGAEASVTYSIASTTATSCGNFTFTAEEDGEQGTATLSGVIFTTNTVTPSNKAPIVTANSGNATLVVALGENVTIMVTATKQDIIGTSVSFPRMVNSAAPECVATIAATDPVEQIYPNNTIGAEASVTYSIANNGTAIACGTFTFNATEDELTGTADTLTGVRFVANEAPRVTANSGSAHLVVATGQNITLEVTATKQDIVGSGSVSFPRMINSTAPVCVAAIAATDSVERTYSNNTIGAVASVTYSIVSPSTATNCGNFTFTATEDEKEGMDTLRGVSFTNDDLFPTVTANSGNAPLVVATGESVTIMVTATKRDVVDSGNLVVSFPREITSAAPVCTATITGETADPVERTYPTNTVGAVASVTYSITSTTATNCGDFTFNATEDGKTGTGTLNGVRFINNEAPTITANSGNATLVVAIGESVTIMVTATKQDIVGSGNVSFPRSITSATPVCTATITGETANPVEQTYPDNTVGAEASVTYSIANNGAAIACGNFTFTATEDGVLGTADTLSGVQFIEVPPTITANSGDATLVVATGVNVSIIVTATKRDTSGTSVVFPSMVTSADPVCVATITGETADSVVQAYLTNEVDAVASVTYSIANNGAAIACGNFTFTATEDEKEGMDTLSGVSFTNDDLPPDVAIYSGNAPLVVATGESVTIMVTATKRDNMGSGNVSFTSMVTSAGNVCTATITGETADVQTYPTNTIGAVASVTYSIANNGTATNCGTFTFNATEDGESGTATLNGVRFIANEAPTITANSGNATLVVAIGANVVITVTATKRDIVGSGNVSFTSVVNSAGNVCVATITGAGTADSVERTYLTNGVGAEASVTYSIVSTTPTTATNCGNFTFTATEDGLTVTAAALNGVGFAANEAPTITATSGDAPLIVALGQSITIIVTATKRDTLGSGDVSFPSMINSAGDACTATITGETADVRTYSNNTVGAVASVTYSIASPSTATNCGNFTFTATEDGLTGTADTLSGVRFIEVPPTVTATSGNAPLVVALGQSIAITVTATKQDGVGSGNVSFPRSITSATPVCTATITGETANPVEQTYSNNTVGAVASVTYSIANNGTATNCGTFTFTATEDGEPGTATLNGVGFAANEAPTVTATSGDAPLIVATGESVAITVTATKQDIVGSSVAFPRIVNSAGNVCVAIITGAGTDDLFVLTYTNPSNQIGVVASVTYSITSTTVTDCGDFTFNATEDGLTGTATLSDVSFIGDVDFDDDGLIEIRTAEQLNMVRNNLAGTGLSTSPGEQGNTTGCPSAGCSGYELAADIDLTAYANWDPIGSCSDSSCASISNGEAFNVIFDGNGYAISNLNLTAADGINGVGLFGAVFGTQAIIRNVTLNNVIIAAPNANNVGALVGYAKDATITTSSVTIGEISGGSSVGGLVGGSEDATITSVSVVLDKINGNSEVGGLVGSSTGTTTNVAVTSVAVSVVNGSSDNVGGLIGSAPDATIVASTATVEKLIGNRSVGGLIGYAKDATIGSSYSFSASIDGAQDVGALVGASGGNLDPANTTGSYWVTVDLSRDGGIAATITYPNAQPLATNMAGSGQTNMTLSDLTDFTTDGVDNIFNTWASAYCHPATGAYIESSTQPDGFVPAWDLGTSSQLPALNCLGHSLGEQRIIVRATKSGLVSIPSIPYASSGQRISFNVEEDWYRIVLSEETSITLSVTGVGIAGVLYNSDGNEIGQSAIGTVAAGKAYTTTLLSAGIYYLAMSDETKSFVGAAVEAVYTLIVGRQ